MADLRFLIVTWEDSADLRHCAIADRCYEGPIVIGDRLSQLLTGGHVLPVDLTVEEIRSYGHLLAEIDPVLTGELLVSGTLSQVEKDGESFLVGKRPDI